MTFMIKYFKGNGWSLEHQWKGGIAMMALACPFLFVFLTLSHGGAWLGLESFDFCWLVGLGDVSESKFVRCGPGGELQLSIYITNLSSLPV